MRKHGRFLRVVSLVVSIILLLTSIPMSATAYAGRTGEDEIEVLEENNSVLTNDSVEAEDDLTEEQTNEEAGLAGSSGSCGENVSYSLEYTDDTLMEKELRISGSGAMADYVIQDMSGSTYFPTTSAPWSASYQSNQVNKIVVENGVTSIGNYAFCGIGTATSASLGKDILSIGKGAFWGNGSLKEITLPENIQSIGVTAFYHCVNLQRITIPGSVQSIERAAFNECQKLADVYYGGSEEDWENPCCQGH